MKQRRGLVRRPGWAWLSVAVVAALIAALVGSLILGTRPSRITACGEDSAPDPAAAGSHPSVAGYSGVQLQNAALIIRVGASLQMSRQAQTIAVMVAAGESSLRSLTHGDTAGPDSRGLFQQRANWGSLAQRLDPTSAAHLFYRRLDTIDGWEHMTPTGAAHAVQGNADPTYYTPFWRPAVRVVAALSVDLAEPTACSSGIDNNPRALAATLVSAIDAGMISGLAPDHLKEIRWIAEGRTVPNCRVDTRVLQIIATALDTFHRIGISDINRHCTRQILGAGTQSSQ